MFDRTFAAAMVAVFAAAACVSPTPPAPAPARSECVLTDEPARSRITIGVAASGTAFDGQVHSAVRIAGAQLHETLVRVDCAGTPAAALADEWSTPDSVRWRFRIAAGATFADGTSADAPAIVSAWSAARTPQLAAVTALTAYDLHVTLHAPAAVGLFALPELAVVRPATDGWPQGTGPYSVDSAMDERVLRLVARAGTRQRTGAVATAHAPDTIEVRTFGRDLRTAIDAGVDALITNDAATVAYARARSDYVIEPLPWSRTYVLATAVRLDSTAAEDVAGAFPAELLRAPARPAVPPFWWLGCETSADAAPRSVSDGRVLYARDDPIARAIAERIAALARSRAPAWLAGLARTSDGAPVAAGASPAELRAALRSRTALAVIASLPRIEYAGCQALGADRYDLLVHGWHLTPLSDTREDLVFRPGIGRVVVDAAGMILFGAR